VTKDLIIIGGGPAGITAAIYAPRKKMDFTVITRDIGGQAAWAGEIENYTGYQFLSGRELAAKFREHLEKFKFDLREGFEAIKVLKVADGFKVELNKGEGLSAKTIIIASGKKPRWLNVPGEAKFLRRGLTFCATCDGPLFAGKQVAVIGGGNSALDATMQMLKIASKVYLINHSANLTGDAVMQEKIKATSNVEILNNAKTLEILGDKFVSGIRIESGGRQTELAVQGVFVEIGLIPNSEIIDFVEKNAQGEIVVNCAVETSVPGLFAAGDVTSVPEKQIIIAAGEGSKAALAAFKYLSTH
jgi:alkyl hydroperoxide reductase subunit F